MTDTEITQHVDAAMSRGYWSDAFARLWRRKLAMICFVIVLAYVLLAVFIGIAEILDVKVPFTQWNQQVGPSYQKPLDSYEYVPEQAETKVGGWSLLGTDFLGESTWRKTLYGCKTVMLVAFCASLISIGIGVPLGAIAGYYRGWVDDVIVWFYTTLGTIPYILLLMAFAVALRGKEIFGIEIRGSTAVFLAIGLTSWVGLCRLIRGEIIKRKESEYVLAARAMGCSDFRILFVHLLPNVFHIILINFSLRFVSFIHAEVILSFPWPGRIRQAQLGCDDRRGPYGTGPRCLVGNGGGDLCDIFNFAGAEYLQRCPAGLPGPEIESGLKLRKKLKVKRQN